MCVFLLLGVVVIDFISFFNCFVFRWSAWAWGW